MLHNIGGRFLYLRGSALSSLVEGLVGFEAQEGYLFDVVGKGNGHVMRAADNAVTYRERQGVRVKFIDALELHGRISLANVEASVHLKVD